MGRRHALLYACLIGTALVADLGSKHWAAGIFAGRMTLIPQWLRIEVVRNHGFVFGLFGQTEGMWLLWFQVAAVALVVTVLAFLAWQTSPTNHMRHLGIACMIGGALGNGANRLFAGYVVDFIAVRGLPIFNIADLFIFIGMILGLWSLRKPEFSEP